MKLIWPGIFLGTGAVGTAGGLYGNSLYLKSVSRQEANIKFEEIKSDIEKFVKGAAKDDNSKDSVVTILRDSLMNLINSENKSNNFKELKENLKGYLKENKEEILEDLYRKMEVFVKFLNDSGIYNDEYRGKVADISLSSEEETLSVDD